MNRTVVYAAVVVGILMVVKLPGSEPEKVDRGTRYSVQIPDFQALTADEANQAVEEATRAQTRIANDLVSQLRRGNLPRETKAYPIFLLGVFRSRQGVNELVKLIDFEARPDRHAWMHIPRWFRYPAQEALVRIGQASVSAVLPRLGEEDNDLRRKLMCSVIREVEDREVAIFRVQRAIAAEKDDQRKARLALALKVLEQMPQ